MPHGNPIATLRDLLDVFADEIASGATIEYTDEHGSWTLRDVVASDTGFAGWVS